MVITVTLADMVKGVINSHTADPVCVAAMKPLKVKGRDGQVRTQKGMIHPYIGWRWIYWTDPDTGVRLKAPIPLRMLELRRQMQYQERHEVLQKDKPITIYLGEGVACGA